MTHAVRLFSSLALFALAGLSFMAGTPRPVRAQTPTFELDTLLVQAASRLPGGADSRAVTLIGRDALERRSVATVSEALRWVLGADLQARSPAQGDLSLRGSSYEGVLVLVDGVRMSDPQTGHFDLDLTVPLERVERIEVVLGPASAQFGADAVGGVVNVVTRRGSNELDVRAEAGSFGRRSIAASRGIAAGPWDMGIAMERTDSDGHRVGTDYEVSLLDAHVQRSVGAGLLGITFGHARRDFGAADFYGPFPAFEATRTTTASAHWSGDVGRLEIMPRFTFRRHVDDFILFRDDPDVYRNNHVSDQIGGDVAVRYDIDEGTSTVFGGEWARESLESNNLGNRAQDRVAGFAEVSTLIGSVRSNAGVRVDHREGFDVFVSPSLSLSVPIHPAVSLRAGAGRAFRTPTWTDRYYEDPANIGTADLDSERSWTVEAGADARLPGGGVLGATVFRRKSDSLIDWARPADDDTAQWRTRNVESATFDGLEVSARIPLGDRVMAHGTGSWLSLTTSEESGFTSKSTLRPIVRAAGVGLEYAPVAGPTLYAHMEERRRQDEDGVLLLEARVGIPVPRGQILVTGTNLTDAGYPDLSGLPAAGRALSVGARFWTGR